jgi:hypothetical protein
MMAILVMVKGVVGAMAGDSYPGFSSVSSGGATAFSGAFFFFTATCCTGCGASLLVGSSSGIASLLPHAPIVLTKKVDSLRIFYVCHFHFRHHGTGISSNHLEYSAKQLGGAGEYLRILGNIRQNSLGLTSDDRNIFESLGICGKTALLSLSTYYYVAS